ncbi:DUF2442 domain-containing protein [uncultured Thiodictyon sp.]|jgi:hypothetical protein|uniref:DUF2442 domain-containing protein n=1 Tax=uncultured Thiodictyon sp. TaxID=1846217 RepID=UPI0025D89846|nr:DUF2442 domain-containing protein [uncultured Thiodictyon sp.]
MISPTIESVIPLEGHLLLVTFANGKKKKYDTHCLMGREMFAPLKNGAFFQTVAIEPGGYAISWNSEIDLSEHELWQHGEDIP